MPKKKIIFQGEPGANSHLACREAYPEHEPVPCPTFEDCFAALIAGDVDLGMIPIENSVAGRVADIHHLMPSAGLHIIAEWFLPIRNQLMAVKGASLKTIKTVQSHVMALGQCRNVIRELKLKRSSPPTPQALPARSRNQGPERAAIASRLAAEIYGLDILKEMSRTNRTDHAFRRALAREEMGEAGCRQDRDDLRLQGPQRSGCALQGARRVCNERRQYDEARKLHGRR
jgi:prephenate dehydratase